MEHPGDIFSNASVELLTTDNKLKREKCKYSMKRLLVGHVRRNVSEFSNVSIKLLVRLLPQKLGASLIRALTNNS